MVWYGKGRKEASSVARKQTEARQVRRHTGIHAWMFGGTNRGLCVNVSLSTCVRVRVGT